MAVQTVTLDMQSTMVRLMTEHSTESRMAIPTQSVCVTGLVNFLEELMSVTLNCSATHDNESGECVLLEEDVLMRSCASALRSGVES
eukprot:1787923-Amphidinium_carterae.1